MKRTSRLAAWLLAAGVGTLAASGVASGTAQAEDGAAALAGKTCGTLESRVAEIPGSGPVFLRSYDSSFGVGQTSELPLREAAFTYDNALAVIALVACGKTEPALRIGESLLSAATLDRARRQGRLRNTYRAGAQTQKPIPPNGWWDVTANRWFEDAYQVGSATGNVAWAGLALMTLGQATGEARFRNGAAELARWVVANTADPRGPGGFNGGVQGFDDKPQALTWKATEHNTDLVALFGWLERSGTPREGGGDWAGPEKAARGFLDRMWADGGGHFPTGTAPDGVTVNRATSGLDAQLWPLLLRGAPEAWRAALDYAEKAHGVDGGFDFNDDRDGMWVEGTAQAALVYRLLGRSDDAQRLLAEVGKEVSRGGHVWATREDSITTGLAIGPDSTTDDFRYYRRPHLAVTAWTALAAVGWNPFTGERVK
ncbi:hypothetical protein Sp245p_17160 (plasmid) [Azospirillum baldaniorum]|uniref:Methylaspartate ammonia-lyase n=1 Tax=Azospirillum baldaniorum TaxID=1064539 RepID=A0A9P1NNJ5_9PROT|nr:hypothetical protein [Azospirillum baldaniorum]AWJ91565.1 hypothetical protein Sp245p_17160 [Azospirillum baldaniorum]TWA83570.1 hypothetical protein FBZ85_101317 [Azospirillum brasilense]CCC99884.1 conserved hypothetical protein; putative signal peptide [Azospirillum baldaniorum]